MSKYFRYLITLRPKYNHELKKHLDREEYNSTMRRMIEYVIDGKLVYRDSGRHFFDL